MNLNYFLAGEQGSTNCDAVCQKKTVAPNAQAYIV